jgi:hypothetical protein
MWWAVWRWTCSCIPRRRHRLSLISSVQIWIGGLWRCVVVGGSCSRLSGGRRSRRFPRSGWMARRCFPPHVYVDGELRSPMMDSSRGLIIIPQPGSDGGEAGEFAAWAYGVSASNLGLATEAIYLYPHLFQIGGLHCSRPHGDGYTIGCLTASDGRWFFLSFPDQDGGRCSFIDDASQSWCWDVLCH